MGSKHSTTAIIPVLCEYQCFICAQNQRSTEEELFILQRRVYLDTPKSALASAHSNVCLQTPVFRTGRGWCSNIHLQVLHTLKYRGITMAGLLENCRLSNNVYREYWNLLEFKRLSNLRCSQQWFYLFHWTSCGWETMISFATRSWNAQAHPESTYLWLPVINMLTLKRIKPLPLVQRPIRSVQTVLTVAWTH